MSQPYGLDIVHSGRGFTLSYRDILPAYKSLNILISTPKDTVTHLTDRTIVGQGEQLGVRLLKNPRFAPGNTRIFPVNLDDRSDMKASTTFFADPSEVFGGTILEDSMIPRFAFQYGGSPIESSLYERILQCDTDYILSIKNEGFSPTDVVVNLAFYETVKE